MKIPNLFELGMNAGVSLADHSYSLTREQRNVQEELRANFAGAPPAASGIVYPWLMREQRDMSATGTTSSAGDQGGMLIGTSVIDIGPALRRRLVIEKLGARVYGGLRSYVRFPSADSEIVAEWKSENADAPDGSFTFRSLLLQPKRVCAYLDVSWQLLTQQHAIENYLRTELFGALAEECQRVAIAGSGANHEPLGILNTPGIGDVVGGADGAEPDYEGLTELEYLVAQGSELESTGWVVSPRARRALRRTPMFDGGSVPIWSQNEARSLLGHPAGITRAIPDNLTKGAAAESCSAIIHAEFSELLMGFWGPGIVVDAVRHGGHTNGKTRFVAHAYFDSGVRAPAAFAAQKDALCAE